MPSLRSRQRGDLVVPQKKLKLFVETPTHLGECRAVIRFSKDDVVVAVRFDWGETPDLSLCGRRASTRSRTPEF
jgi:hypothetical protein